MDASKELHVAVGVISNRRGEVLIAKRRADTHLGGLWEFPGGKIEAGEHIVEALQRELKEELNIETVSASPLIKVRQPYSSRHVLLDVWHVDEFRGQAVGHEGQVIAWVATDQLTTYDFPQANRAIIAALKLPKFYAILDDENHDVAALRTKLHRMLDRGIRLVQIRAKGLADHYYYELATYGCRMARRYAATVLLNTPIPERVLKMKANGLHLTSRQLMQLRRRPLDDDYCVAASCHSLEEMQRAERLGLDFVVLSPVLKTLSHPAAQPLGWATFESWVSEVNIPVYALGGMTPSHLTLAQKAGGQGVAGIRGFS